MAFLIRLFLCQFNYFQILELAVVDSESDEGTDFVETVNTCSTGVDAKHVQGLVVLHLEYVRMSANKKAGRTHEQVLADGRIVTSRVSADVLNQDISTFDGKTVRFSIGASDISTINVAINSTKRAERSQLFGYLPRTDIACMPYLVAILEIL